MGRVASESQEVNAASYQMSYTYNLLGQLSTQTYPTGRVVAYGYDAGARLFSVGDGARTYASGIRYEAHGGLKSERWGNGAVHEMSYNRRLQPAAITLTKSGAVLQQWRHEYGQAEMATGAVDAAKNAGQIARIEDYRGGSEAADRYSDQRFGYDSLGRLERASEHRGSAGTLNWRVDYDFDRYGNRFQRTEQPHDNFNINFIAVKPSDINAQTNRFTADMDYDAAGNITTDAKFRRQRYDYDALGRVRRAAPLDNADLSTSVYDGQGQRVLNMVAGEAHTYVYNWMGEVVAEYGSQGWERDRISRGGQLLATDEAVGSCRKTIAQFVVSFYRGALNRTPNTDEHDEWTARLKQAQGQGSARLLIEAQAFGRTLFESEEYVSRQRTDAEFVTDLYWGYLQRAADHDGTLYWRGEVERGGRSHGLNSFAASIEYRATVAGLCETGAVMGEAHWSLQDHVGSVRVITNSAGAVIGRRDNLPFGDALRDVGEADSSSSDTASADQTTTGLWGWHNTIRTLFAGMEKDAATGLEHATWRKYDAWQGRWISPDPFTGSMSLGNPQSFNRYSYVENDPLNMADPTGLFAIPTSIDETVTVYGSYDPLVEDPFFHRSLMAGSGMGIGWAVGQLPLIEVGGRGGGGTGTQNSALDVDDLRDRVANMVGNSKCADFIINLLNGAATLTGNPAVATDALKLFDAIRGQGSFVYKDNTATFGFQASTISGSISGGNAQVLLAPPYPNPSGSRGFAESQARIESVSALHETLHLAGRNGFYSDETFAVVVKGMPGQLPPRGDITKVRPASGYWGSALSAACAPKPR